MFDSLLNSKFHNKWYGHGSITFRRFSSGSRELQPLKLAGLLAVFFFWVDDLFSFSS
jgi:hypothetical protein